MRSSVTCLQKRFGMRSNIRAVSQKILGKQCYRHTIIVSRGFVISRHYGEPVGRYGMRIEKSGKRSGKRGNIGKIVQGRREKEREGSRREGREGEKYLSLPEIPGMNGSINSPGGRENYWMECSEYML